MTNLEQWEKRLGLFYTPTLRLIAEIPISIDDVEEMGAAVISLIRSKGMTNATNTLVKRYPLTMLTLMASYAAYNTQQNYWQSFADFLEVEITQMHNQRWRHHFVKLAKRRNLKVFDFEDAAKPFVTSIRFQGGIPTYSLPDFFERIVLPTVERKGLSEIPASKAMEYMLEHALFVDSPVLNFLRNSGDLGVEFFEETRKLVRHALKNHGEILPYQEVDLPINVINAFESYWERREDEQQHWRKPEIAISPYSEGSPFFLLLPEQEIKLEQVTKNIWWQIQFTDQQETHNMPCKVFHKGPLMVTNEDFYNIDKPISEILVSIHTQDKESGEQNELRRWKLSSLPTTGDSPVIVFHDNGRLISNPISLPAESLFIVHPVNMKLDFDGPANLVEERIKLQRAWEGWVIEFWNLSQAWSLRLMEDEKQIGNAISVLGKIELPELFGGHKFQYQDYPDQPFYTTDLPALKIPLKKVLGSRPDLFAWKIEIKSLWETNPQINDWFKLGRYESQIKIEDQWVYFPLSLILGTQAVGKYQIDIHGPRDIHETFRIRVWPKLLVVGLESELQPQETDQKPYEFVIRLPQNAGCETQPDMEHVHIEKKFDGFQIIAKRTSNRVKVFLTMPTEQEGLVRLPVSFPLPFPLWGLASDFNQGAVELSTTLEHKSLDFMKQNSNAALHVEMYGLSEKINHLRLQLFDQNNTETLLQEAKFARTEFTRDWLRVGLSSFSDTIRQIHDSGVFKLLYYPADRTAEAVHIPLLVLNRELEISNVQLDQVNEVNWKITWQEEHPLRNRRVMLLPAWQPWQSGWEYKIPDSARGEFLIEGVSLPLSRYCLYFYVRATWESPLITPPINLQPFIINFCEPEQRIQILNDCVAKNDACFKNLLEMAVIFDSLGDTQKTGELVTQAARYLKDLSNLDLLLRALKWIGDSKNIQPPFKSYFHNNMFHPQIVKSVLERYKNKDSEIIEYLHKTSQIKNKLPTESAKLLVERIDDPITIHVCLESLMKKHDEDLPIIVVNLMRAGKLSKMDAFDLLFDDFLWALLRLDQMKPGPFVDSLIADLSTIVINSYILDGKYDGFDDPNRVMNWVVRSIPYLDKEIRENINYYLELLFIHHHNDRYLLLIDSYLAERITAEETKRLLSIYPFDSFQFLNEYKVPENWQEWSNYLVKEYPAAFGLIRKGSYLNTPIGKGKIISIAKLNNGELEQATLDEKDLIFRMVLDVDGESFHFQVDFINSRITMDGYNEIRKCRDCDYYHPNQENVLKHSRLEHGVYRLDVIPLPIIFDRNEITFIN